jgi:hypothetical protein
VADQFVLGRLPFICREMQPEREKRSLWERKGVRTGSWMVQGTFGRLNGGSANWHAHDAFQCTLISVTKKCCDRARRFEQIAFEANQRKVYCNQVLSYLQSGSRRNLIVSSFASSPPKFQREYSTYIQTACHSCRRLLRLTLDAALDGRLISAGVCAFRGAVNNSVSPCPMPVEGSLEPRVLEAPHKLGGWLLKPLLILNPPELLWAGVSGP